MAIIVGIYLLVKSCSTDKPKDKAETPPKPCHIDTTNIAWYSNDTTITEFTISTAKELIEFAELAKCKNGFSSKTIKLGANIILNDTTNWKEWKNNPPANEWKPIEKFKGTFDGKGYVIGGVYINSYDNEQGLFGSVNGTIKNLGVVTSYVKGKDNIGGLAGENWGVITDSYFIGIVTGKNNVGGLVGDNGFGDVVNSHFIGNVIGIGKAGGIVGDNFIRGKIINSYSKGTLIVYHEEQEDKSSSDYHNDEPPDYQCTGSGRYADCY